MKKASLFLCCCLAFGIVYAQTWQSFTNTSHIYDLQVRDAIYMGTWGGAVRISDAPGQSQSWNTIDGISANDIRSIEKIAASGDIWLGSSTEGISIIKSAGVQQVNSSTGLPSNRVRKILERDSHIYVATDQGLSAFFYLEGVSFPLLLHQYTVQNTGGALVSNDISDMLITSAGYLYISTAAGLSYVHLDSLDYDASWRKWTSVNSPLPTGTAYKLSANESRLAIGTLNRVYTRDTDPWVPGWIMLNQESGILNHQISALCIDRSDRLWIAYGAWSEDQLSYSMAIDTLMTSMDPNGDIFGAYEIKHWQKRSNGLGSKSISKIQDSGSEIVLGTWGEGLYRSSDLLSWDQYLPNSIGFPKITDIQTDANYSIWLGGGVIGAFPVRKSALGASVLRGNNWTSYTVSNSPITTDNILNVGIDANNRKWFGTWDVVLSSPPEWKNGIAIYDDEDDTWKYLNRSGVSNWNPDTQSWSDIVPGSLRILGNTIGALMRDKHGNMLVACYNDGINVISPDFTNVSSFTIPNSVNQRVLYMHHNGSQYFFGTNNDRGLVIWNNPNIPVTGGAHWVIPPVPELNNCIVYGVGTVESSYEGRQHFIAASTGLFMWNESNWYKYDTTIKRYIYTSNGWQNDTLYYVDEERLFASIRTTPTSIYRDPFNRIWIGSLEGGFSMYNPRTERFTNYYMANSPLLSNYVTALGYEPTRGWLLIGTPDGLNALPIGKEIITTEVLESPTAFPNPFYPDREAFVRIVNRPFEDMPRGNNQCRIYDSSGALVIKLEQNEFARFDWNGRNSDGKKCSSGIYFFVISDDKGNVKRGKLALVR